MRSNLGSCKNVWNNIESSYLPSGAKPQFYDYILEKVQKYKYSINTYIELTLPV